MLFFQLRGQVGKHSTWYLIQKSLDVDTKVLWIEKAAVKSVITNRTEVISDLSKKILIKSCIIRSSFESFNHNFCCRLGSSQCKWGDCCINDIYFCFYCFHICHGSNTGSIMCMQINRNLDSIFQCTYKFSCFIWKEKSCHIFDTDGICSHFFDLFCNIYPVIKSIRITKCIGKCHLCMSFFFVCCFYCCLKVTHIIQTVKDTDNIDSVCCGFLYKIFNNIISIWTISQDILSTKQHLKFGIFESVT